MDEEEKSTPEPEPEPVPQPGGAPPAEDPAPEPVPAAPTYAEALEAIRGDMEKRIAEVRAAAERDIKERDDIIRQLMNGSADNPAPDMPRTVADGINARRNFTKW